MAAVDDKLEDKSIGGTLDKGESPVISSEDMVKNVGVFVEASEAFCGECYKFRDYVGKFFDEHPFFLDKDYMSNIPEEEKASAGTLFFGFRAQFLAFRSELFKYMTVSSNLPGIFEDTPWNTPTGFTHNIGISALQCFFNDFNRILRCFYGGEMASNDFDDFFDNINNFPYFIDQTVFHIKTIQKFVMEAHGSPECDEDKGSEVNRDVLDYSVERALSTVLRCRILYGDFHIPGVNVRRNMAPTAKSICRANLSSGVPIEDLVEMLYVPVSNSHRIMNQEIDKRAQSGGIGADLRMEVFADEITWEGQEYLVLEVFNTGKLVDLTALQREVVRVGQKMGYLPPELLKKIKAHGRGSRQVSFNYSEDFLVLEGLTMTSGGTGLGLSHLEKQVLGSTGIVWLNNVYDPEKLENEGFCVTLILDKNGDGGSGGGHETKKLLFKLKELLQSGKYFLDKAEKGTSVSEVA